MDPEPIKEINLGQIISALPHLSSSSDYWLVRTNGGKFYTDFINNEYVGIGVSRVTLEDIDDSENLVEKLKQTIIQRYPEIIANGLEQQDSVHDEESDDVDTDDVTEPHGQLTSQQLSGLASQLLHFTDIQINDIVVCPTRGSGRYAVGRVTGKPYWESNPGSADEDAKYDFSGYNKRIPVKWIKVFNRDEADAKLLKLSYLRHTINDIDNYRGLIDRVIYNAYILDGDELHLTFMVEQEEHIPSRFLGSFMYHIGEAYYTLSSNELISQVNVQSKGPVHLVFKDLLYGLVISTCVVVAATSGGNFNIKIVGQEATLGTPGIMATIDKHTQTVSNIEIKKEKSKLQIKKENQEEDDRHRAALLNQWKEAYELSRKTGVPMSKLQMQIPEQLLQEIQKQLDTSSSQTPSHGTDLNTQKKQQ
jgi:hypothetical protein